MRIPGLPPSRARFLLLLPVALFALAAAGCHHEPSITGIDALPGADQLDVKRYDTRAAGATVTASSFAKPITGAGALYLPVGRSAAYESQSLLRWYELPYDIDSGGRIVSAKIRLYSSGYHIGSGAAPADFSVRAIQSPWSPYTFTSDSIQAMRLDPVVRGRFTGPVADSIDVEIDTALVRGWLQLMAAGSYTNIGGVLLEPSATATAVHAFESTDARSYGGSKNSRGPKLIITMNLGGAKDTTFYGDSQEDAAVTRASIAPTTEIGLHGGLAWRSRLTFDVSAIPRNSVINGVSLYLTKNTANTRINFRGIDSVIVYRLMDSRNDSLAATYASTRPADSTGVCVADGYPMIAAVQTWLNDPSSNHGLLLVKYAEVSDLDYVEYYGPSAEPALRPRLVITYTERP
jgi:hypothetical protein